MYVILGIIILFSIVSFTAKMKKPKIIPSVLALSLLALAGCSDIDNGTADPAQRKDDNSASVTTQEEKKDTEDASTVQEKKSFKKSTDTTGTTDQIPVTLVKTIDGDTIKVLYKGKEKNVRYLLIDTPETNHPRLGKQPYGEEAKERNRQLVNSGDLTLEFDIGERVDKYGRLLAYVYADGKSVQKTLLEEGLARVAYVYPPNTRHLTPYEEAQNKAKAKEIGIWSIENYATDTGFKESSSGSTGSSGNSKQQAANSEPANSPASMPSQSQSGGKEYFQNCTELTKVYPNGVPEGHPAYQAKMDRDKDGYACER